MDNYESMTEKELLIELLKGQKEEAKQQKIKAIATICVAVLLALTMLITIPRYIKLVDDLSTTLTEVSTLTERAEKSLDTVDEMIDNVNKIVVDNTDTLSEAMEKINKIDFDELNEAIQKLSKAIEPMAQLSNWFK